MCCLRLRLGSRGFAASSDAAVVVGVEDLQLGHVTRPRVDHRGRLRGHFWRVQRAVHVGLLRRHGRLETSDPNAILTSLGITQDDLLQTFSLTLQARHVLVELIKIDLKLGAVVIDDVLLVRSVVHLLDQPHLGINLGRVVISMRGLELIHVPRLLGLKRKELVVKLLRQSID